MHREFDYQTKDYIYAMGSKYPDEQSKKCEVYDITSGTWQEISEMNVPRHYHTATIMEDRYIYIIGGRDSVTEGSIESIEKLDGHQDIDK